MMHPRHKAVWLAALLAGAVGALALALWLTREPAHQGRSLSQWLADLDDPSTATNVETRMALRQMADRAAVRLVPMLEAADSPLKLKLVELTQKQPFVVIRFTPASVKHKRAEAAFELMADRAMAASPRLVSLLVRRGIEPPEHLGDPASRAEHALHCIGAGAIPHLRPALLSEHQRIRQSGLSILQGLDHDREPGAIAELVKALDDPEPEVREGVAYVLGKCQKQPEVIVPHLVRLMGDPDSGVRRQVAFALGRFGPRGNEAITALRQACSDADAKVQHAARLALAQIEEIKPLQTNGPANGSRPVRSQ